MKIVGIVMRKEFLDNANKWFLNESYLNAIEKYNTAIFPICSYSSLNKAVNTCCGVILPGGYDLHGYYLKEQQHKNAHVYENNMDHFDFACIEAFRKRKKGILGICRGMQTINVYFHGTLNQQIDETNHHIDHVHSLNFSSDSFLNQLYTPPFLVNSYHHQSIAKLGSDCIVAARSEDQIIEAIQHTDGKIIGVQWHPEKMDEDQVIPYFLDIICA